MKKQPIDQVDTAEQARDLATHWQATRSNVSMSYAELIKWQTYFEALAEKFPELTDEFKENGII